MNQFFHLPEFEENIRLGPEGLRLSGIDNLELKKKHFFTSALLGIRIKIYKNLSNHLLLLPFVIFRRGLLELECIPEKMRAKE